jgi:dTDP-4-dehydrorhamnose 3,5-epimerase
VIFTPTPLPGAYLIELEKHEDERGFFARAFCTEEFARQGLPTQIMQANLSYNQHSGTLRGLHYQKSPHSEPKLVRVIRGSVYEVIIDLRPDSATYCQWYGMRQDWQERRALFIPACFAHGFLTLTPDSELYYEMFAMYNPEAASGVRYDDPCFHIEWPADIQVIADKDRNWPDFTP